MVWYGMASFIFLRTVLLQQKGREEKGREEKRREGSYLDREYSVEGKVDQDKRYVYYLLR